jgi:hypothetical protein
MRRATAVLVLAAMLAVAAPAARAAAHGRHHHRHHHRHRALGGEFHKLRAPAAMAVYEWHTAGDLSDAAVRQRLGLLRADGFRTVYLEIGNYLDAAELPAEDPDRAERLAAIGGQIKRFVATAGDLGLSVQALGGGPTWTGGLAYLGRELVALVGDYNAGAARHQRLKGVQLDLEPYTLEGWLDDDVVEDNLREYLRTLEGIVGSYRDQLGRHGNHDLRLGFAIPFWLDARGDAPGPVDYNGATKPAAYHVIDLVADLPGAYLVVMSYRNFARTANGSIAHARDEFRYAAAVGARSGLVVGQRYGQAEAGEERTTFYGKPRWMFRRAAAEITLAFRRYPQFRGLSVDDADAYLAAAP